jgi:hypothetical protein
MAFKLFDNVMESSTTTGTGNFTLAGAITGFSTFASRYSTGDTCYYAIKEVDAAGGPSGAWEVGIGTYSAANTLTRTTVLSSSNSDAAVNFAAGTKRAFVTLTALQGRSIRERLTAARTYYVRTDGSDSNTGLTNASGGAFLTIQKAMDVAVLLDTGGYSVTAKVADGTYTGSAALAMPLIGGGEMIVEGNTSTPANTVIGSMSAIKNAVLKVQYARINTSSSFCLYATTGGLLSFSNVEFNGATAAHIRASFGGNVSASGNYSIVGAAPIHAQSIQTGQIGISSKTVTITGTPNFSTAYAVSDTCGAMELYNNTYSGSATGVRFAVSMNGVIQTYTGNTTLLPGNSAGTTATGGQYA